MVPLLGVHFVNRTPHVSMGQVEAEFVLTRPVATISCRLQGVKDTGRDCMLIMLVPQFQERYLHGVPLFVVVGSQDYV